MPRRARLALVVPLALLAVGCGGGDDRSAAAKEVAALCDAARSDIEGLGLPAERGIAVLTPWANRGTRLANEIRGVEAASAKEAATVRALATALDEYYAGLRLGRTIYEQTRSSEAYAQTVERAKAFLADADEAAAALGAPECAIRPFAD